MAPKKAVMKRPAAAASKTTAKPSAVQTKMMKRPAAATATMKRPASASPAAMKKVVTPAMKAAVSKATTSKGGRKSVGGADSSSTRRSSTGGRKSVGGADSSNTRRSSTGGRKSVGGKTTKIPERLQSLKAVIVNLERRQDRWERVTKMLDKETPYIQYEKFPASDGKAMEIPTSEVSVEWNTNRNAHFADFEEYVYDDCSDNPERDGEHWKWVADTNNLDEAEFRFIDEEGDADIDEKKSTVENVKTGERFKVRQEFAERYREPGLIQRMSPGERGCAHSHYRVWKHVAEQMEPVLVLEDDVQLCFDRTGAKLGKSSGKVFTERLNAAMEHLPDDFDVLYLGWSGFRGGNFKLWSGDHDEGLSNEAKKFLRKAEYVWTTVAYVLSPAGAKKLLEVAQPLNQPVDNFMAWEASQSRLNSFVAVDVGDGEDTWAGGIVDQFDFQGDSDIAKSDGGVQGDDAKAFTVDTAAPAANDEKIVVEEEVGEEAEEEAGEAEEAEEEEVQENKMEVDEEAEVEEVAGDEAEAAEEQPEVETTEEVVIEKPSATAIAAVSEAAPQLPLDVNMASV